MNHAGCNFPPTHDILEFRTRMTSRDTTTTIPQQKLHVRRQYNFKSHIYVLPIALKCISGVRPCDAIAAKLPTTSIILLHHLRLQGVKTIGPKLEINQTFDMFVPLFRPCMNAKIVIIAGRASSHKIEHQRV